MAVLSFIKILPMSEFLISLANTCTEIINDPEANVKKISEILDHNENKEMIYLSLAKVFKSIVPLYKVRIHSDKIKHKIENNSISKFDKDLFTQYNLYVKELCQSSLPESFRACCELLASLDHFNFVDRIVSKVLIGTTFEGPLSVYCVNTLVDRVKNDVGGDTIFLILNQCLDYKYSEKIVEALLESKYLEKCVEIRIDKEEKYNEERLKLKKLEEKMNKKKNKSEFFKNKAVLGHQQKKELKKILQTRAAVKEEEDVAINAIEDKNYIKTVNALQRLYFTIFKNKVKACYAPAMKGALKYIRIIRKEFHEGLYILLNDAIKDCSFEAKIEGIYSILKIFKNTGYDFKNIVNIMFNVLHPMNFELEIRWMPSIREIIRILYIENKQPVTRAITMSQRLIQARCCRDISDFVPLIKDLEITYDLDYTENDIRNKKMYDPSNTDIDKIESKPFYEYFLFKKVL